jgi:P-type Cu+ transporter
VQGQRVTETVHHCSGHDHAAHAPATARDPVCGMTVDPQRTAHRHAVDRQTYYFCSAGCRAKFAADPDKYLNPAPPAAAPEGALYTCPMHPEVQQVGPGSCPICGMALEPVLPAPASSGEEPPDPELVDMSRRFWGSLVPTAALFLAGMA